MRNKAGAFSLSSVFQLFDTTMVAVVVKKRTMNDTCILPRLHVTMVALQTL